MIRIIHADVLAGLAQLPDDSVHCVVTSPPYWGLRDYGTGTWEGGDAGCEHLKPAAHGYAPAETSTLGPKRDGISEGNSAHSDAVKRQQFADICAHCGARRIDAQLGLEPTLAEHLDALVAVFEEVRRVLRPDGVCFLNYGDAYAGYHGNKNSEIPTSSTNGWTSGYNENKRGNSLTDCFKPKDLMLIPERLSIALQEAGWWVRDRLIMGKRNPMPSSAKDRCTPSYELVYMLTRSARYWSDMEAIKEPVTGNAHARRKDGHQKPAKGSDPSNNWDGAYMPDMVEERNARNIWMFATEPSKLAHFAAFSTKFVRRCLAMACPERVCAACGAGWVREVERGELTPLTPSDAGRKQAWTIGDAARNPDERTDTPLPRHYRPTKTLGWHPSCDCNADTAPGVVLDPFGGTGTVGLVADRMNRDGIMIELSADYCRMARERIEGDGGLFADVDDYDADDNARKSYDVAIDALRERHEAEQDEQVKQQDMFG